MSAVDLPQHSGPGQPAPCGCLWESGQWFPCVAHAVPHSLHTTPAPGCDLCEDLLTEARGMSEVWDDEDDDL